MIKYLSDTCPISFASDPSVAGSMITLIKIYEPRKQEQQLQKLLTLTLIRIISKLQNV